MRIIAAAVTMLAGLSSLGAACQPPPPAAAYFSPAPHPARILPQQWWAHP